MPALGEILPSLRSIAVGLLVLVLALGGYAVARSTSMFAVSTLDVHGGSPALRQQVRAALADELGRSLLRVDEAVVAHRLDGIPGIRSYSVDRAFPHTLRIVVRRETPVLVVRRVPGEEAFLVGASGEVIRPLAHPRLSRLPRLWVTKDVPVSVGSALPSRLAGAAAALAALRGAGLPGGVSTVTVGEDELTLKLGKGMEVRLGDTGDLRLKLAIARRILRVTGAAAAGTGYLDVSVPGRPVLNSNPQVEGRG